jgi:hypothetical protein
MNLGIINRRFGRISLPSCWGRKERGGELFINGWQAGYIIAHVDRNVESKKKAFLASA